MFLLKVKFFLKDLDLIVNSIMNDLIPRLNLC